MSLDQLQVIDKRDVGMSDFYVKDEVMRKIATVPMNKKRVALGQKAKLDELIAKNTVDGKIDLDAVSPAFQKAIDELLK